MNLPRPLSLRTMFTWAFTAVHSALVGVIVYSVSLVGLSTLPHGWQGFLVLLDPDPVTGLPGLLPLLALPICGGLALALPVALAGGLFIGYKYRSGALQGKLTTRRARRLAALTGTVGGATIAIPYGFAVAWFAMHPAHNWPPPPIASALLKAGAFAIPIIVIASVAGIWTGKQLATPHAIRDAAA